MESFLYLDFYAIKPTLFIKKQDAVRTHFGSILSIITIIILIIIIVFIVFCFIYDTGLTVLYEKSSKGMDSIDLNLSKNIFFYRLTGKGSKLIDSRIIKTYPYLTISTSEGTKYELLKESNCDIDKLIKADPEYKELLNFDITSYKCVTFQNDSDAIMQRRTSPFKNSYINLFIAKCQNNTNEDNCASENEINDFIESNTISLSFFLESASVVHQNYSHPIVKKYYQNSMSIPKDFIFSYTFFWRKIEYYTRNTFILFNYLFQKSTFILDATIKDKDIYSKNANFYVDKTIGRMQFLITVEYADYYIRKYITLIDSLTIIMTTYNIITKLCWILNALFSKSYLYCSIFEPIFKNSVHPLYEIPDKKIISFKSNTQNKTTHTRSHSSNKLQISQFKKDTEDISVLKLNNINNAPLTRTYIHQPSNMKYMNNKTFSIKKKDEIKNILIDIQKRKINNRIGFSDNFLFYFAKFLNIKTKKQLYLKRVEKLILNDLSLDYLFQEIKNFEKIIYNDINNNIDFDLNGFYDPSKQTINSYIVKNYK